MTKDIDITQNRPPVDYKAYLYGILKSNEKLEMAKAHLSNPHHGPYHSDLNELEQDLMDAIRDAKELFPHTFSGADWINYDIT